MANILVTGGAGYLGSVLVPALLDAGHHVYVLDSFRHGQEQSLAACCANPRFEVTRGDCRDPRTMRPLLAKADVVIPLAAIVGAPACDADFAAAEAVNVRAILQFKWLLSQNHRVLFPMTNSGYGSGTMVTEDDPLNPVSLYGRTKVEAEKVVLERENAISFRFATLFGMSPRMRVDLLVNDFVHHAVHDRAVVLFEAGFRRNYLHVRDAARAFLHGIENFDEFMKVKGSRAYNVGLDDANLTKRELCELIQKYTPFDFHVGAIGMDPDRRDYTVSNARIAATGFKPAHSLDSGIMELIKGFTMLRDRRYGNG